MRLLILVVVSLAAAAAIGLISLEQPGLMVVSYGKHSLELPLVLALLFIAVAFALLYLLFNFLFALLRAPKRAKAWNEARQNKKAQDDTLRGYARLIEGDWAHGEKELLRRMPYCKTPMLNYLGAAYAAQQQHDFRRRDEYLSLAEGIDPRNRFPRPETGNRSQESPGRRYQPRPYADPGRSSGGGSKPARRDA